MDPVTLILGALTAGAAAALKDVVPQAIKDAYAGLKALVEKKFADKPLAQQVLQAYESDPETYTKPLEKDLKETGADQDEELLAMAQKVMALVEDMPGGGEIISQSLSIRGNARVGKVIQAGKLEGKIEM